MWQRFSFDDVLTIGHYLGVLTTFFSFAFVAPFVTAILCQEWEPMLRYLMSGGIALTLGTLLRLMKVSPGRLTHQQAMAVTGLAWLFLAMIAAIPLYFSGHYASHLDALFEGVSGLTTTGASLVVDLEHMAFADNMWRFVLHFIGGLGLIVVALALGLMGSGTSGLYSSEGRSDHVLPNIVSTTRLIGGISLVVIAVAAVFLSLFCLASGMEPIRAFFNALWIAISGFMTAGFAPTSQSVSYYHSYPLELVCMVLMLLGSISFALLVEVWKGRTKNFFQDIEVRVGVIWIVTATVVFMASLAASDSFSGLPELLRRGVFMVISAMSTTGFSVITGNQMVTCLSSGALLILILLMAIGGSSGSTAGGMKLMRVGIVAKSLVSTVKETMAPENARVSVVYRHLGRHVLSTDLARSAMTVSTLFVLTYVLGALAGVACGYDAISAIFDSVSMASNGGLSAGVVSAGMPAPLELIYIVEMWAGRLEFVTLIALLAKLVMTAIPRRRGDR